MTRLTLATGLLLLVVSGVRAQPANDDCADATMIGSLPFTDAVDTTAATTEAGDPVYACDGIDFDEETRSVWYRYTSPSGGSVEIDTFGSDYDTSLAVWRGTCGSLGDVASCNGDDWDDSNVGSQSRLVVALGAGETVYVEVTSSDLAGGNLAFNVKESPVFQVTDEIHYGSQFPDVAAAADGTFLVVWEGDNDAIVGRRYCDTGIPLGPPFEISEPGDPTVPRVARTGSDEFVVVWIESSTLQGRRLNATGAPLGLQFEVADDYPSYYNFDLAGDAAGRFVVTWESYGSDGDNQSVVAQRFDAANAPLGSEFLVNTYTTGLQFGPSVATDSAGNFVVAWESEPDFGTGQDSDGSGVFGQRYDSAGATIGGEFQVNVTTTYDQQAPAVAVDPSGAFVVAWLDPSQSCGQACVIGRRYDAGGAPQGGEFVVSDGASGAPSYYISIDTGMSAAGDFAVAWADENDFPRARAFDAGGTPVAGAFQVGLVEQDYQRNVRMAMADDGDFVVVWDWAPQGSHYKIMGRAVTENPNCPVQTGCPPTPRFGCKQPTLDLKGNLTLKDKNPDTSDAAIWKWVKGEATTIAEIGDALTADSYSLCVYDGNDALLADETVAPGGTCATVPCWKDLGGTGFKYADKTGANGDVRKLVLKSGEGGRAKVIVKVQGASLLMPPLPPVLPVRAQLASTTGTCWEAEFRAEGVTKSTPTVFGGKPSLGSPGAAFVD